MGRLRGCGSVSGLCPRATARRRILTPGCGARWKARRPRAFLHLVRVPLTFGGAWLACDSRRRDHQGVFGRYLASSSKNTGELVRFMRYAHRCAAQHVAGTNEDWESAESFDNGISRASYRSIACEGARIHVSQFFSSRRPIVIAIVRVEPTVGNVTVNLAIIRHQRFVPGAIDTPRRHP
jgi:hypothetical protein